MKQYISLCNRCSKIIEQSYILDEIGQTSECSMCHRPFGVRYEFTPRRPRYRKATPGGGERRSASEDKRRRYYD